MKCVIATIYLVVNKIPPEIVKVKLANSQKIVLTVLVIS